MNKIDQQLVNHIKNLAKFNLDVIKLHKINRDVGVFNSPYLHRKTTEKSIHIALHEKYGYDITVYWIYDIRSKEFYYSIKSWNNLFKIKNKNYIVHKSFKKQNIKEMINYYI